MDGACAPPRGGVCVGGAQGECVIWGSGNAAGEKKRSREVVHFSPRVCAAPPSRRARAPLRHTSELVLALSSLRKPQRGPAVAASIHFID
jgi:hypothetical protein